MTVEAGADRAEAGDLHDREQAEEEREDARTEGSMETPDEPVAERGGRHGSRLIASFATWARSPAPIVTVTGVGIVLAGSAGCQTVSL